LVRDEGDAAVVHAVETSLQALLEGSKQYQVPLYQRTYSWQEDQLARLWDDVVKLAADRLEDPAATHFIGSLVLAPSLNLGPVGVQQYLVVDGQQRLTSLSLLLLCALRDHRAGAEDPMHRDRINDQYLINKWKPAARRLKLWPTQADRDAYLACVDATPQAGGPDRVGAAYRFFRSRLQVSDDVEVYGSADQMEDAVIGGLSLVSVTAQAGDNVYRIFESLNNTGMRLSQGDLLRNYLFMRLPTRADEVYQSLWLPMQELLDTDELEQLFWLDMAREKPRAKQTEIYADHQKRLERIHDEDGIEREIKRLAALARLFKTILDPSRENDPAVADRLTRLNLWGANTVRPLVLHLLDRRAKGTATSAQIARAMHYVEAFVVRRLLTGRATTNLNRILLGAVTEMPTDVDVDVAVRVYLSTGRKYYATDQELRQGIRALPFYLNGRPNQRKLILSWIEESYGSREPVQIGKLTIEHVLPQSPGPDWLGAVAAELKPGESVDDVYEALVHTLGNLTLTGYNSALSNKPFDVKRPLLADSGVAMNKEIAAQPDWGRERILDRADELAQRARELWPGPIAGVPTEPTNGLWEVMNSALAALPAGRWTTYGDLAALIGSHPMPVGVRLANYSAPNAHRVLQADGSLSPGFRWLEPDRTDDPLDLLRAEGVVIDDHARASAAQRVTTAQLARLAGLPAPGDEITIGTEAE
jgi:alkylated DNA nucleotide flippase Atl1